MGLIHYKYLNQIDEGTIYRYDSQVSTLPASNIQNLVKSKVWRTDSDFVVTTRNREFVFRNTATTSVLHFSIPSGTYTGSGLASVIQTNLNSVGNYADHTCTYNSSTLIFTLGRTGTAGVFELPFSDATYQYNTVAVLMGFENSTDYSGSFAYTSTTTYGNEHELVVSFTSTQSVNTIIIDGHNWRTGTVVRLRGTDGTASVFSGGWNTSTAISLSSTLTYNSGIISEEFTATTIKHMQLYWYDRKQNYSDTGRVFMGLYFQPQYRTSSDDIWRQKKILRRSEHDLSYAGVTWVDRKQSVTEYTIGTDPMDPYYNNTTKTTMEAMLDYVGDHRPFWISLDTSLNSQTVYGLIIQDTTYDRLKNTPVIEVGTLKFREQR